MLGALLALAALSGCTKTVEEMSYSERQALAGQIVQRCYAQGVKDGTPEMRECIQVEAQGEIARRNRRARVEDARRSSGGTVCNRFGNTVVCS